MELRHSLKFSKLFEYMNQKNVLLKEWSRLYANWLELDKEMLHKYETKLKTQDLRTNNFLPTFLTGLIIFAIIILVVIGILSLLIPTFKFDALIYLPYYIVAWLVSTSYYVVRSINYYEARRKLINTLEMKRGQLNNFILEHETILRQEMNPEQITQLNKFMKG